MHRLSDGIDLALENEKVVAPDVFLRVKESVLAFITTMEVSGDFFSWRSPR